MKKLFLFFLLYFVFINSSQALIEVDITRGNLDPLPIAVSPLHVDIESERFKDIKIKDLIYNMIKLSGLTVKDTKNSEGDIEVKIIGLRPGEKLYEELLIGNNVTSTSHNKIMRAKEAFLKWKDIEIVLKDLSDAVGKNDEANIIKILSDNIDGFVRADNELV